MKKGDKKELYSNTFVDLTQSYCSRLRKLIEETFRCAEHLEFFSRTKRTDSEI